MTAKALGDDILLDYASGSLPEPLSLLVATHLALCPEARRQVRDFERLGGALLEELEPAPLADDAFEHTLCLIDRGPSGAAERPAMPAAGQESVVPEPLRSYLGTSLDELAWKKRGAGIEEYGLPTADDRFRVAMYRIGPGRAIPEHGHEGAEFTLVLDGAFSDGTGRYGRGDVSVQDAGDETHHPVADAERGCICLAVMAGPLKFSNPVIRLIDRLTRN